MAEVMTMTPKTYDLPMDAVLERIRRQPRAFPVIP
jgi:hypothetical protein